jgi:hypothetical protein
LGYLPDVKLERYEFPRKLFSGWMNFLRSKKPEKSAKLPSFIINEKPTVDGQFGMTAAFFIGDMSNPR